MLHGSHSYFTHFLTQLKISFKVLCVCDCEHGALSSKLYSLASFHLLLAHSFLILIQLCLLNLFTKIKTHFETLKNFLLIFCGPGEMGPIFWRLGHSPDGPQHCHSLNFNRMIFRVKRAHPLIWECAVQVVVLALVPCAHTFCSVWVGIKYLSTALKSIFDYCVSLCLLSEKQLLFFLWLCHGCNFSNCLIVSTTKKNKWGKGLTWEKRKRTRKESNHNIVCLKSLPASTGRTAAVGSWKVGRCLLLLRLWNNVWQAFNE